MMRSGSTTMDRMRTVTDFDEDDGYIISMKMKFEMKNVNEIYTMYLLVCLFVIIYIYHNEMIHTLEMIMTVVRGNRNIE